MKALTPEMRRSLVHRPSWPAIISTLQPGSDIVDDAGGLCLFMNCGSDGTRLGASQVRLGCGFQEGSLPEFSGKADQRPGCQMQAIKASNAVVDDDMLLFSHIDAARSIASTPKCR